MQDVGCAMWDVGCRMWGVGCRMWDVGCAMWDAGCASRILHPKTYSGVPASCTLHPASCTLHPASCTLHPASCTLLRSTPQLSAPPPSIGAPPPVDWQLVENNQAVLIPSHCDLPYFSSTPPPPRFCHELALDCDLGCDLGRDPAGARLLLFGGSGDDGPLGDLHLLQLRHRISTGRDAQPIPLNRTDTTSLESHSHSQLTYESRLAEIAPPQSPEGRSAGASSQSPEGRAAPLWRAAPLAPLAPCPRNAMSFVR